MEKISQVEYRSRFKKKGGDTKPESWKTGIFKV